MFTMFYFYELSGKVKDYAIHVFMVLLRKKCHMRPDKREKTVF